MTFDEEDLPLHPRPDPTFWLVRLLADKRAIGDRDESGKAGQCAWAQGDLERAEKAGLVTILQRPLLEGVDAVSWRLQQKALADAARLRKLGLAGPRDIDDVDDWTADAGGSHLLVPHRGFR